MENSFSKMYVGPKGRSTRNALSLMFFHSLLTPILIPGTDFSRNNDRRSISAIISRCSFSSAVVCLLSYEVKESYTPLGF